MTGALTAGKNGLKAILPLLKKHPALAAGGGALALMNLAGLMDGDDATSQLLGGGVGAGAGAAMASIPKIAALTGGANPAALAIGGGLAGGGLGALYSKLSASNQNSSQYGRGY